MHQTQPRASAIWLRDVLPHARLLASDDIRATSCSADWQACQPGDVFFAVTTAGDDGHEHVSEAIARGATAVVSERLVPAAVPQALVRDSRAAFARTCQALAGRPSRQAT